ncbi:hypothetical protein POVWA1_027600 [Plasmodium ovale wallikeri]|uniref:Uncharacterized protein n=1 Tax=Plasmodium ovale wallikeri TaxID=864142 RepID=A0A1A8YV01_PLAOA|nr:hypothetical protein POVWA1_027600 [Plasmodium ovale wallikeri]
MRKYVRSVYLCSYEHAQTHVHIHVTALCTAAVCKSAGARLESFEVPRGKRKIKKNRVCSYARSGNENAKNANTNANAKVTAKTETKTIAYQGGKGKTK